MKQIFSLCFSLIIYMSSAQVGKTIGHTISSKAFDDERTFYVHLPKKYFTEPSDSFMVVVVLDAQAPHYWNMAKGNLEYMVNNSKVLPMIAVGIHTEDRGREFIPAAKKKVPYNNDGIAHLLLDHLKNEVLPYVEKKYRVNKMRAIVGHSRGGAFISHTLFSDYRDLFVGYIGISPAMGYIDNQILDDADALFQKGVTFNKFLYCTHGDVGYYEKTFAGHIAYLDSLLEIHPSPSLTFEKGYFPTTDHWSVVAPSWNQGLVQLSRQFRVDQKMLEDFAANESVPIEDQIHSFYKKAKNNLGIKYSPPIN